MFLACACLQSQIAMESAIDAAVHGHQNMPFSSLSHFSANIFYEKRQVTLALYVWTKLIEIENGIFGVRFACMHACVCTV